MQIAIISEAASSGISLQADRRVKNQRIRVHITLELDWSGDRALELFRRTHRSTQTYAPEYVVLVADVAGERYSASVLAQRLERLGARAGGDGLLSEKRDLSIFDTASKSGKNALSNVMQTFIPDIDPLVPLSELNGIFITEAQKV